MIQSRESSPGLERELILATVCLDESKIEHIGERLRGAIDWSHLFRIATQQGLLPLFCQQLVALAENQIPIDEITHLKKALETNTQNCIRLSWKLIQCVELLEENGINCINLKGPVLALQAYGDLKLRQFSDLDILIHPMDFPKAYDVLEQAGYSPSFKLDEKQRKYLVRTDNHFSFNRLGDIIEVHWGVAPRENIYPISEQQMWLDVNSIQVFDKKLYTLSLENMVIFICLHGAKHGWRQLKWIVDLAYLSRYLPETSWLTLIEHAKRMGFFRQVCLGLLLSIDLVDALLPSKVVELIKTDQHAQLIASKVRASLFEAPTKPSRFGDYLFYLNTRERWQDRFHYVFDLIIKPKTPDWRMISLPENMYLLYYIIRPIRLLFGKGKAPVSDM